MRRIDDSRKRFHSMHWSFLRYSLEKLRSKVSWPGLRSGMDHDTLLYWRNKVLHSILLTTIVLGFFACVPSVLLSVKEGLYHVALFDCLAYAALLYMFFSSWPSFKLRAVSFTIMCYLVGLLLLVVLGPFGAGPVWLFLFPVLTGVLLGYRASIYALLINGGTIIAVGVCLWFDLWSWSEGVVNPIEKWVVIFFNFMLLNSLATVSLNAILKGLQSALLDEKNLRASLQAQQEQLTAANLKLIEEITEKELVRKQLDERDKKLLLLAENALDCIWQMDGSLRFTFVNPAVETVFGYTPEEWIGTHLQDHCPPGELPKITRMLNIDDRRDGPPMAILFETDLSHKDGRLIPVEILAKPLLDEQGRKVGLQGAARDISERKMAEKQKADFEAQIIRAQKLESVGTLAGGIAHDFNNILSAVLGYTELALDDVEQNSQLEENLREILKAGVRAKNLVRQILAFSRRSEQEIRAVQVSVIVKEALKMLRSTIPSTIQIARRIETESMVLGDPTQIHQVLMNLCTNAVHAMEEFGGVLTVELTDVHPSDAEVSNHTALGPWNYLKLTVADTGTGMRPEIMEHIFDPYFTTKKQGKGTGLGLSVAHGIVKSHHGEIMVDSAPGKGTIFAVYFPRLEQKEHTEGDQDEDAITGGERILLVDDEPALVDIGQRILERLGYRVTTSTESVGALELFRERPHDFDLVITDMTMPDMTGDRLASEMIKIRPDIPIILCTGYSDRISDETIAECGARTLAMKPFMRKDLAVTVRRVLDENQFSLSGASSGSSQPPPSAL